MLTIWGRLNSINVQKPLLALEELGVPYLRHDAGMAFGVVDTPDYRALNPNGVVPTINDDGFVLWESNTIVRYLARKHGAGTFWPDDLQTQANAERWMDWQQTTLLAPLNAMFLPLIRNAGDKSPEAIETGRKRTERNMTMLDTWLADRRWIAGEAFGAAECVLGPTVHRWYHLPIARPRMPNLDRWFGALMERPSAKKIIIAPIT